MSPNDEDISEFFKRLSPEEQKYFIEEYERIIIEQFDKGVQEEILDRVGNSNPKLLNKLKKDET